MSYPARVEGLVNMINIKNHYLNYITNTGKSPVHTKKRCSVGWVHWVSSESHLHITIVIFCAPTRHANPIHECPSFLSISWSLLVNPNHLRCTFTQTTGYIHVHFAMQSKSSSLLLDQYTQHQVRVRLTNNDPLA